MLGGHGGARGVRGFRERERGTVGGPQICCSPPEADLGCILSCSMTVSGLQIYRSRLQEPRSSCNLYHEPLKWKCQRKWKMSITVKSFEPPSPILDDLWRPHLSPSVPHPPRSPEKLPRTMKKSTTTKSAFSHFREEDIVENQRLVTIREAKASVSEADDEVDAKAGDFINKFKQQLQL